MKNILVFGDSHSLVFNYCNWKQSDFVFNVVEVPGATAQGSVNPDGNTHALNIFTDKLKSINVKDYAYIIINLGEVDCGFVIWYRQKKYNISVEEQLELSVNNLFQFIQLHILQYFLPRTGYCSWKYIICCHR